LASEEPHFQRPKRSIAGPNPRNEARQFSSGAIPWQRRAPQLPYAARPGFGRNVRKMSV